MDKMRGHDELLDETGRLRGPWRRMLGTLLGMGTAALRDRAAELDRACVEEGAAALLAVPHAGSWRCDPIPYLLTEAEFSSLALGLAQRADVLEDVLQDVYGPRRLLAEGLLPPALVYPSSAYLRPCRTTLKDGPPKPRMLTLYAADLVRGPDGAWCVLADRTAEPAGLAYALENRRIMGRVLPELFRSLDVTQLPPFFDIWQDSLQRLVPEGEGNPGIALLTPGHADPRWFEHVVLARALNCSLVEDGDLTVREGKLFVKTLRGLQPLHVVVRRQRGHMIDPLELPGPTAHGTPGLLTAWRAGSVQLLNAPGSGYAEAPALAAFMPQLLARLRGQELMLPSQPTLWLGDPAQRARYQADPAAWQILPAMAQNDAGAHVGAAEIAANPAGYVAIASPLASIAPCVGRGETLDPRPVALRLFLLFDGLAWRPLPGGLARVLEDGENSPVAPLGGRLPFDALCKDVWVLQEEGLDIYGPSHPHVPALPIRRTAGEMPSRVADNFYWLGRYLERLENGARLIRAVLSRLARGTLLPRDLPDMKALIACMAEAGIVDAEMANGAGANQLADLVLRALTRDTGMVARMTGRVRDLADNLRDRLSGEMHATIAHELRRLKGNRLLLRPGQRAVGVGLMNDFCGQVLQFCATVSGYAAENMVRGGGRLFLDLGRRIERAQEISVQLSHALDHPPERIETGLALALELCDSTLTYRARYLTAVQPAPVIDLVVADEGNPRALGYQLVQARSTLALLGGRDEAPLAAMLDSAISDTRLIVADLAGAEDQAELATALAPRLHHIATAVASVSDAVMRQYFALLPVTFTDGMP